MFKDRNNSREDGAPKTISKRTSWAVRIQPSTEQCQQLLLVFGVLDSQAVFLAILSLSVPDLGAVQEGMVGSTSFHALDLLGAYRWCTLYLCWCTYSR